MKKVFTLILACGLLLTGCSRFAEKWVVQKAEETAFPVPTVTKQPTEAPTENIYEKLPREFAFTSGAGGWVTTLTVEHDGTFSGVFTDSNMGEIGEGYPSGTMYICNFSGRFSPATQMNTYTYSMQLEDIQTEKPSGEIYYEDGIKYICDDPYGFDDGQEFLIYLPGTPVSDLQEGFLSWARFSLEGQTVMPADVYGIYNVRGEQGFVGKHEGEKND